MVQSGEDKVHLAIGQSRRLVDGTEYKPFPTLYESGILQRCMRDINAAAQHMMVSDSAYENHGQALHGSPNVNPMG